MAKIAIEMNQEDVYSCRIWFEELIKQKNQRGATRSVLKMPIPTERELEALLTLNRALAEIDFSANVVS